MKLFSWFICMLTILFIAFKLAGVIAWSWLWVLAPLWLTALAGVLIVIIAVGVFCLAFWHKDSAAPKEKPDE